MSLLDDETVPNLKPASPRTEGEVWTALAKRYPSPQYALLAQVSNATGWGRSRYADALAFSLWPSRGLHLHGFEIKVYRNDWLRELKNPAKAEEIAGYCHFWWIAAGPGIVRLEELPPTWGLLEIKGKALVVARQAPENKNATPLDVAMIASILRRASEHMVPRAGFQDAMNAAREEGVTVGRERLERDDGVAPLKAELEGLRKTVRSFEEASGVKIGDHWHSGDVGLRFRRATAIDAVRQGSDLNYIESRLKTALDMVRAARRGDGAGEQ